MTVVLVFSLAEKCGGTELDSHGAARVTAD